MSKTDKLQLCIFKLPTKCVGYDWTFNIGSAIYDKIDSDTINKCNDEIDEKTDNGINNIKRKYSSQLKTSWLVTNNDLEFILTITITPGMKSVLIYTKYIIILS